MNRDHRIWTIPNLLCILRIGMVAPMVLALLDEARLLAFGWMALGVVTDVLDGFIARRWNQRSHLGLILDPLADKIATLSVLFVLTFHPAYSFPIWYFVFMLIREGGMILFAVILVRHGQPMIESISAGKKSSFANGLTLVFFLFNLTPWCWIVLSAAMILTIISSWNYFQLYLIKRQEFKS